MSMINTVFYIYLDTNMSMNYTVLYICLDTKMSMFKTVLCMSGYQHAYD